MKKNYILILMLVTGFVTKSQDTIRFESQGLPIDSSWNGSDLSGMFSEDGIDFLNSYNTAWSSWSGFGYSSMRDTTTPGYTNDLSCIAAKGANNSQTYGVGYAGSTPTINFNGIVSTVEGFWVNNGTYAYLSMKNGDGYGKRFGDTLDGGGIKDSTNGEDWFKLTTFVNTSAGTDTVEFYLADYRFADSTQDYIIKDWTYVTLPANTNPTSLTFAMSSSDTNSFGSKTPSYFCIDNLNYTKNTVGIANTNQNVEVKLFPNPSTDYVNVTVPNPLTDYSVSLIDANGRLVKNINNINTANLVLDIAELNNGIYMLTVTSNGVNTTKRIIKN